MDAPFAGVAETHVSVVFFVGDRAYKLLKPLTTPFLDHATRDKRERGCWREVELNRRLAPDVYLGVHDVVDAGRPVDHLVVMRRLPAERKLSALVGTDELPAALRSVARAVAVFHGRLGADARASRLASRDGVAGLWRANLDEMAAFVPDVFTDDELARVDALASAYLQGRLPLFAERVGRGCARDGHGDLLSEDIFVLDDGPRILDCLAFDDDLRAGDVLLDVAFLAMDLEQRAGGAVADRFLAWYDEFSGERHPPSLAHHYVAYRALVRAKVSAMRAMQGDAESVGRARSFLGQCRSRLERAVVRLVLVGGAPGTGKTTIARGIGEATGAVVLSSDELRKEQAGLRADEHAFAAPDEGLYAPDLRAETYGELLRRAGELLERGESVVLDASWSAPHERDRARTLALATHSTLVELCCELDPAVAGERIARRLAAVWNPSDATPEVAEHLRATFAPWPAATRVDTIDAATAIAIAIGAVEATLP